MNLEQTLKRGAWDIAPVKKPFKKTFTSVVTTMGRVRQWAGTTNPVQNEVVATSVILNYEIRSKENLTDQMFVNEMVCFLDSEIQYIKTRKKEIFDE